MLRLIPLNGPAVDLYALEVKTMPPGGCTKSLHRDLSALDISGLGVTLLELALGPCPPTLQALANIKAKNDDERRVKERQIYDRVEVEMENVEWGSKLLTDATVQLLRPSPDWTDERYYDITVEP